VLQVLQPSRYLKAQHPFLMQQRQHLLLARAAYWPLG
jgi:hypothetical protein